MERLLNDELEIQITEMLKDMKEEIVVTLFTEDGNEASEVTEKLIEELSLLNEKITVVKYDYNEDSDKVKEYGVEAAPAYLMAKKGVTPQGVFYGVPAGHEINTILTTILDASESSELYDDSTLDEIKKIDKPTDIKVFVTTGCPHCPGAAINALRLAQLNKNVNAKVYEVHSNMEVSNKYQVQGVPKIVINETEELVGNQPITEFLRVIG